MAGKTRPKKHLLISVLYISAITVASGVNWPAHAQNATSSMQPNAAPTQAPGQPELAQQRREEQIIAEAQNAWRDGVKAGTQGPAMIELAAQASMRIPEGQIFIPSEQSARILRAFGNRITIAPYGLVADAAQPAGWLVVVQFHKEGYIRDDDAKNWNADDLLANIKANTQETNRERAERGFTQTEIIGWLQKPAYDATSHRLIWALASKPIGAPDDDESGVNYNTYALGREGYFTLNLLTNRGDLDHDKAYVDAMLNSLDYRDGKRYQDFNPSSDTVAAYGLAALVGGLAAKKLGFLAIAGAFLLKFAKVIFVAVLGLGAVIGGLFKRKK